MIKEMRAHLFNTTRSVVEGLIAGMHGGVVGGAVLGLVLMVVADEGPTAYFVPFVALLGGAIGVPIGVITGMLKPAICRGTITKVTWIVVSALGAGLGARLFDGYDMAIRVVFTVLGAIIAAVCQSMVNTAICQRVWRRGYAKKDDVSRGLSPGGFSLGRTRSLCSSGDVG